MNPSTGRERELTITGVSDNSRTVLVVGGGPAGMEAARLAALRGHTVVLAEASSRLGGRLVYAAKTYAPNADVLRWLEGQIAKLDIDVRLDVTVDANYARTSGADVVIAALGADWTRPAITGVDLAFVHTVDQLEPWLVGGRPLAGDHVIVIGGGRAGMGLADLASQQGKTVTVVEASSVFAPQIGLVARWRLVHELQERGVELISGATVDRIDQGSATVVVDDRRREVAADIVFVASRVDPRDEAVNALRSSGLDVRAIGDCTGAGFIEGAMLDAATLAVSL